jgi:phage tail-like protein
VPEHPFTTFNFRVELSYGPGGQPICGGEFAECDGLEMTLEPKTIREGGNNSRPIHLVGPVSHGQLTLKRGMTTDFGLWKWFEDVQRTNGHGLRASGSVALQTAAPLDATAPAERRRDLVVFELQGCLPVKLKAPALNAKDGLIAVEEMQVAYETLTRRASAGGPG